MLQGLDGVTRSGYSSFRHGLDGLLVDTVGKHELFVDSPVWVEDDDHVLA